MKRTITLVALIMAFVFPSLGFAQATSTSSEQHEGIEITVNINTATAEELATLLKGVGLKKAQQIVEYRETNGPFKAIDELALVKGIGKSTIEKNQTRIKL